MTDFVDRLTLLIAAEAGGANSVIKGFGSTTQAELSKTATAAGQVGGQAGTLFSTQFSQQAILGLSAIQATLGGIGLSNFAEGAVEEAVKFGRASAELAAQIKSTGDAAGTSVEGIDTLSASIEKQQLIYSGTVKQGAALLLTFQDIRNQAGQGNDIFDRTLTVSAAVANVFNKDITASVLQVGRALENPQAGIQALSRSGLTLEQQDRERILNLAKQGDLLGAQKALLDALESRTLAAGAAAAQADPIQRATLDFEKFKVAIGQDLTGPAKVALAAIEGIEQSFAALPGPVRSSIEVLVAAGVVLAPIVKIFSILGTLKSIKIAADASSARIAAESLNEQTAATEGASNATTDLQARLEGYDIAAAKAAGASAELGASLDTIGASGSAGVAAVEAELDGFDSTAASAASSAANLRAELASIGGEGAAGIATIDGQLSIFDANALGAASSAGTLGAEIDTLGASGVAGVASLTDQLSLLSVSADEAAIAIPNIGSAVAGLSGDIAPAAEQIALFETGLGGVALGLNQAVGQFALFDAAAIQGGASVSDLDASSIAAAASLKLVTIAAASAQGELALFDAAAVTGGSSLADIDAAAAAAAIAVTLVTIAVGNANEQLTLFGPSTASAIGGLSGIDAYLTRTAAEAAALEGSIAALGDEMSGLGIAGANAATGLGGVDASIATMDAAAAAAAVPIGVDAAALADLAANAGVAEGELGLIGATLATATTEFLAMGGAEIVASADTGILTAALLRLTPVGVGVGGALSAAAAGFAAFTISYQVLDKLIGGHHTPFVDLSTDVGRLKQDISDLQGNTLQKGFGLDPAIHQDQKDIQDLIAGFDQLADTKGPEAARQAMGQLEQSFIDAGGSATQFDQYFAPVNDHLHALYVNAEKAAQATGDLSNDFHDLTAGANDVTSGYLAVADSFDAVSAAAKQVALDQANVAGTGADAVAAATAVTDAESKLADAMNGVGDAQQNLSDAYVKLQDSQEAVTESTHKLAEAQQAYDLYNSSRGALERSLELDQINRRVVTTPAEEDQKRLDLLQFQDNNANKAQSLADQLASAQKGVRDALRGVADAQRNIVDAQKGVVDATKKVEDAEKAVTVAIQKQKQVGVDAAAQLQGDQRKLQEAILTSEGKIDDLTTKTHLSNNEIDNWIQKLKGAADKYAPGSELDRNVDTFYTKILGYQIASNALSDAANGSAQNGPGSNAAGGADRGKALGGFDRSGLSAAQIAALHDLGVPGFGDGGIVPGLRGQPRLIVAHGGERVQTEAQQRGGPLVHQENHFYGGDTSADMEWANAKLAWGVARYGRGS